ncbi:hypothetical protein KM043_011597 [Ampulex compressa]|nr:hypothetical protein KM043_011597 [Ampulex compressa]
MRKEAQSPRELKRLSEKYVIRFGILRTKVIGLFEKMISRFQILCCILLFGAILLYQAMAQVDGYTPGVDYPIYNSVPFGLTFTCGGKLPGYYADPEARCQVWHWCLPSGRQYSFLCPNGTVFSQTARVCDWWFKVDCNDSPRLYGINDDLYRDANGNKI